MSALSWHARSAAADALFAKLCSSVASSIGDVESLTDEEARDASEAEKGFILLINDINEKDEGDDYNSAEVWRFALGVDLGLNDIVSSKLNKVVETRNKRIAAIRDAETERLRQEQEQERQRQEQEQERQRQEDEDKLRQEQEQERQRQEDEDKLRQEQEQERQRQEDADKLRQEQEQERLRQEDADKLRQEQEQERLRQEDAEKQRKKQKADEKKKRQAQDQLDSEHLTQRFRVDATSFHGIDAICTKRLEDGESVEFSCENKASSFAWMVKVIIGLNDGLSLKSATRMAKKESSDLDEDVVSRISSVQSKTRLLAPRAFADADLSHLEQCMSRHTSGVYFAGVCTVEVEHSGMFGYGGVKNVTVKRDRALLFPTREMLEMSAYISSLNPTLGMTMLETTFMNAQQYPRTTENIEIQCAAAYLLVENTREGEARSRMRSYINDAWKSTGGVFQRSIDYTMADDYFLRVAETQETSGTGISETFAGGKLFDIKTLASAKFSNPVNFYEGRHENSSGARENGGDFPGIVPYLQGYGDTGKKLGTDNCYQFQVLSHRQILDLLETTEGEETFRPIRLKVEDLAGIRANAIEKKNAALSEIHGTLAASIVLTALHSFGFADLPGRVFATIDKIATSFGDDASAKATFVNSMVQVAVRFIWLAVNSNWIGGCSFRNDASAITPIANDAGHGQTIFEIRVYITEICNAFNWTAIRKVWSDELGAKTQSRDLLKQKSEQYQSKKTGDLTDDEKKLLAVLEEEIPRLSSIIEDSTSEWMTNFLNYMTGLGSDARMLTVSRNGLSSIKTRLSDIKKIAAKLTAPQNTEGFKHILTLYKSKNESGSVFKAFINKEKTEEAIATINSALDCHVDYSKNYQQVSAYWHQFRDHPANSLSDVYVITPATFICWLHDMSNNTTGDNAKFRKIAHRLAGKTSSECWISTEAKKKASATIAFVPSFKIFGYVLPMKDWPQTAS